MRINKNLIDENKIKHKAVKDEDGNYSTREYIEVDVNGLAGFIGTVFVIGLLFWGIRAVVNVNTTSKEEYNTISKQCDILAEKNPHYVSRAVTGGRHYQCVIKEPAGWARRDI